MSCAPPSSGRRPAVAAGARRRPESGWSAPSGPARATTRPTSAMLLAPLLGAPPREIAERVGEALAGRLGEELTGYEVAGPGFLNLTLSDGGTAARCGRCWRPGDGSAPAGPTPRSGSWSSSCRPTRPGRWWRPAAAAPRLRGRAVADPGPPRPQGWREYYFNDAGTQIRLLGESVQARARGDAVPEGGYQGEYVRELAEGIPGVAEMSVDGGRRAGRGAAARADQGHAGALRRALRPVLQRAHAARGLAQLSGPRAGDRSPRGVTPTTPRAPCGCAPPPSATTRTGCCAARTASRPTSPPTSPICWRSASAASSCSCSRSGSDHHGYVARMKAAFQALGGDPDALEMPILQFVHLIEGEERAAMSKRRGEFITLDELLDEIGVDATRYFMLQRSHDRTVDLDLDLARRESAGEPRLLHPVRPRPDRDHARQAGRRAGGGRARAPGPTGGGRARPRRARR